jgi:hypothetical protein
MDSSVNVPSSSILVLNINITEHSSSIDEVSSSRLFILSVGRDNCYSCILASVIRSYLSRNSVSFNQRFAADIITKNKREEFAA